MRISTKGIYALEVAVDLAFYSSEEKKESIRSIASRRNLSEKYLERIVGMLKKDGIVKSTRGALGGYCLARPAEDITVLEILQAAEGTLAPVDCLVRSPNCKIDCETCATRGIWNHMWELLKDSIKETTIADILKLVVDKDKSM